MFILADSIGDSSSERMNSGIRAVCNKILTTVVTIGESVPSIDGSPEPLQRNIIKWRRRETGPYSGRQIRMTRKIAVLIEFVLN